MVEAEREKRLLKVSQEVFEDSGDDVDIVHLAEHRNSLTAEKLLLQLLHLAISTRQTVQTRLRGGRGNSFKSFNQPIHFYVFDFSNYFFNILSAIKIPKHREKKETHWISFLIYLNRLNWKDIVFLI